MGRYFRPAPSEEFTIHCDVPKCPSVLSTPHGGAGKD